MLLAMMVSAISSNHLTPAVEMPTFYMFGTSKALACGGYLCAILFGTPDAGLYLDLTDYDKSEFARDNPYINFLGLGGGQLSAMRKTCVGLSNEINRAGRTTVFSPFETQFNDERLLAHPTREQQALFCVSLIHIERLVCLRRDRLFWWMSLSDSQVDEISIYGARSVEKWRTCCVNVVGYHAKLAEATNIANELDREIWLLLTLEQRRRLVSFVRLNARHFELDQYLRAGSAPPEAAKGRLQLCECDQTLGPIPTTLRRNSLEKPILLAPANVCPPRFHRVRGRRVIGY